MVAMGALLVAKWVPNVSPMCSTILIGLIRLKFSFLKFNFHHFENEKNVNLKGFPILGC